MEKEVSRPNSVSNGASVMPAIAAVMLVAWMLLLNTVPLASNDLWLQLKIGQMTLESGSIPQTVLFPFTAVRDNVFTAHEWLPSIVFFELSRVRGVDRLMFVQGAIGLLQFGLSYVLARRLSGSVGCGLLMAALAMATANYRYVLRPEIFALLLLVSLLIVLTRYREDQRATVLVWTVPLALVWANCHGSFLLGPVIAAVFALGEGAQAALQARSIALPARLKQGLRVGAPYAFVVAAMLLASVVNPRGPNLLRFAFDVQASAAMQTLIKEWLPTFHPLFMIEPAFWIFVLVGLMSLAVIVALWRQLTVTDALLFLLFAGLALQRNRHIVWFGFVALAVCAHLVGRAHAARDRETPLQGAALALAVLGITLCMVFGNARGAFPFGSPSQNFSEAMITELAKPELSGNIYNSYELGSELIYRDWPRLKPVIDSRIDSYGDDYFLFTRQLLVNEHLMTMFLSEYGVNDMLLLRRDFDNRVKQMPGLAKAWHVRLADGRMLLLERNISLPARPATQTDTTGKP
jgi:hypothetical protein